MCRSCNSKQGVSFVSRINKKKKEIPQLCDYTVEMVSIWKNKIMCIRNSSLEQNFNITPFEINKYLGILNSILVYKNNPCLFIKDLDEIYLLIIALDSQNICQ